MQILFVISRLLDYPDSTVKQDRALFDELIEQSPLSVTSKTKLSGFVNQQLSRDLMQWQSEYDGLFERGRSLGLWLFEHVHGESRDRGQAMVDLMNNYREAGLEISQHELPDYIPLFLEFLVTQGDDSAREWLGQVDHIFALLMCRLEQRGSRYAMLFELLLELADTGIDVAALRQKLVSEQRDDTAEALDKAWEEETVTFGEQGGESCGSAGNLAEKNNEIPVTWMDFNTTRKEGRSDKG